MTTTALLIRHAHTSVIGHRLVGRLPGVMLSDEGCAQVERLSSNLRLPLAAVYSSPLERALLAFVEPNLLTHEREFLERNDFRVQFKPFDWRLNDLTGGRP